jgi:hypothetical protein
MPIQQAVMPLPYKDVGSGLMTLTDNMAQTGSRIGGTAEMAVGEGRQDAPVGTTIALIDQATKVLNAVHKRMHAAQAEEFDLIVKCFRDNPESFWQQNRKPARKWDQETFLRALDQVDLVPQADPNTASQTQRMMKIMALKQIQAQNPSLYDPIQVDKAALQAVGWSNPEQFMIPQDAQGQMPPEMQQKIAEMQIKKQEADAKTMSVQSKAQYDQAKLQLDAAKLQTEGLGGAGPEGPKELTDHEKLSDVVDLKIKKQLADAKMMDTKIKAAALEQNMKKDQADNQMEQEEMLAKERIQMIDLAQNLAVHPESEGVTRNLLGTIIPAITGNKPQ